MINPQDGTTIIQAAIKNLSNNTVFYFAIPVDFEVLIIPGFVIDVTSFVNNWKSVEESSEVSTLIKGFNTKFFLIIRLIISPLL